MTEQGLGASTGSSARPEQQAAIAEELSLKWFSPQMSDPVAIGNLTMYALSHNIEAADVWGLLTISQLKE